jgi:hypothetical protein
MEEIGVQLGCHCVGGRNAEGDIWATEVRQNDCSVLKRTCTRCLN